MTNRKHHCRNCGGVFCGDCSSKKMKLGHLGIEQEVRVCDGCERKLSVGRSGSISKPSTNDHRTSTSVGAKSGKSQEELDFEQAIALSLADAGSSVNTNGYAPAKASGSSALPGVGYGYDLRPSQPPSTAPPADSNSALMPSKQLEADDPDLAAAIRASLAEVAAAQQYQPVATTSSAPYQASAPPTLSYAYVPQQPAPVPSVPSYDLALSEFDALDSFANVLSRNAQYTNPDDANELFYKADRHRGKMMRAMQDADVKGQTLDELNQKLQRAVRLYDALLERGIGQYQRPLYNGYQRKISVWQIRLLLTHETAASQQQPTYNPTQQEYYHRPQSQYAGQAQEQMARPASRSSQMYASQQGQPQLQRIPSSSYPGQRQPSYSGSQYAPTQPAPQPAYIEPQHVAYGHPQQVESQHTGFAQHQQQYYNDQPVQQNGYAQSAYPASAYPYNEPQPSVPYPMSSPSTEVTYQAVYESPNHQTASLPQHEAAVPFQPAEHAAPGQQQQPQPPQMYDEEGNKLRLQGYYKPSSFPAVPEGPVGGLTGLPDAPTSDLSRVAEQFNQPNGKQDRRQEEALIEF